jgi:hypothetical protein
MAHVRAQIRAAVAAMLESVVPGQVFGRVHPLMPGKFPGACVFVDGESGSRDSAPSGSMMRRMTLVVELYVEGVEADDTLDSLAVQVEQLVDADPTFGGLAVAGSVYGGAKFEPGPASGKVVFSKLRLQWVVKYRTIQGDPEHGW